MSAAGYLALLDQLAGVDAPAGAKAEFRDLVLALLDAERPAPDERVQFARHLLAAGEARPVIRDRLQARFGIARAQAYRYIDRALQTVSLG